MDIYCFNRLITKSIDCSIDCQYEGKSEGLFYAIDLPAKSLNNEKSPVKKYYKLCLKMNPIQRQFFVEPTEYLTKESIKHKFVYCPGNYLNSLVVNAPEGMCYEKFNSRDKLCIMKWIFSIACASKILIENNNFGNFLLTDRSIFIDSKMNAKFFYNIWKESLSNSSTLLPNHYFYSPEIINLYRQKYLNNTSTYKPNEELNIKTDNSADKNEESQKDKDCAYSFGILILEILNQCTPDTYFPNWPRDNINKSIISGEAFCDKIPKCPLEPLVTKLINNNKKERIGIIDAIELLIQKKYCLDETIYTEYRNFILEKFNIIGDVDDTKLLEIIKSNLTVIDLNNIEIVQYENLKISGLSDFLKIASTTSFYPIYKNICQKIIDKLLDRLTNQYKMHFHTNKNDMNKFDLIEFCMKHKNDDTLNKLSNLTLLNVTNMADNLSFYISIHQTDRKVKFIIPKSIEISEIYFKKFNTNFLFTQFSENTENQKEIDFYPYLNVYNILYHNSMKFQLDLKQKVTWLYQTAVALSILHENMCSMISFNSQNVYVDLNLNAHLFPSKILIFEIENKSKLTVDFSEKSNFEISYIAPEVLLNKKESLLSPEKSLVYSFGVFMLELIHGIQPGIFLNNFSHSQKLNALLKPIKVPPTNDKEVKSINEIIQSCLDLDCDKRETFSEIVSKFENLITNNSMNINFLNDNMVDKLNSFFFIDNLEEASKSGSTTVDLIFNDLYYNWLDEDGKISYQIYMTAEPITYSRFDIIWNLLNGKDINICQFRSINKIRPIAEKKKEKEATEKVENINYSYGNFVQGEADKLKKGFIRIRNKPLPKFCHVGGLQNTSMRQAILRCGMNPDYNFRQRIEFVVRNKFNNPYGEPMKLSDVNKVITCYLEKGFFKNKATKYFNNPNGNSILDLEVV